jgi:hypothetical protein
MKLERGLLDGQVHEGKREWNGFLKRFLVIGISSRVMGQVARLRKSMISFSIVVVGCVGLVAFKAEILSLLANDLKADVWEGILRVLSETDTLRSVFRVLPEIENLISKPLECHSLKS